VGALHRAPLRREAVVVVVVDRALRFIGTSAKHKIVDRDRRSSLERGHGGIIASRLLYIVEIGLLKNYAESRGPIPRDGSVETLLLSFRSVPRRLLALASKTPPASPLWPHIPAAGSLILLEGPSITLGAKAVSELTSAEGSPIGARSWLFKSQMPFAFRLAMLYRCRASFGYQQRGKNRGTARVTCGVIYHANIVNVIPSLTFGSIADRSRASIITTCRRRRRRRRRPQCNLT